VEASDERINAPAIAPILWRGKYLILASVVVSLLLAYIYTARTAKVYEASAIIQVNVPNQTANTDTTAANDGLAQNYAALLTSSGFLRKIRGVVEHGNLTTADLESRLSASAQPQTALVELHSTGPSPEAAQTIGLQVAHAFLEDLQSEATARTTQQQAQIERTVSNLTSQISALRAQPGSEQAPTSERISSLSASRQALIEQNASLLANGLAQGASATLTAPPAASSSPVSPKRSLNLLAGLVIGLLVGVGLAWLREVMSPSLRSAEAAAALLDVPVLSSVPLRPQPSPDDPSLLEAYDLLQTNFLFAMRDQSLRMVTFVGPDPQIGKTSAVEGLADVLVRGGRSVIVVDGDLRAAMLSRRLGSPRRHGLSELLQGTIALDEAIVQLDSGLSLLPAGGSYPNPPRLLSGSRMNALGDELRERFDIVLVDSPPIGGLADGLILASLSDAVVMVIRTQSTRPNRLVAAAASLRQSRTPIAGLVVFEERAVDQYYYPVATERESAERKPAIHT